MNCDPPTVILEDGPMPMEREDRPRSRTWPILPPPIETIHEHERDAEIAEPPPIIEEDEGEEEACNELQKPEPNPRKNSRKNAWGNLSYADLITRAIQSSPEQRLTLSQIYEWMVRNIPYFKDKGDSTSSAGWKNSIRHNLSLHSRFMRVQNDNNGKSSYWVINPDAKPGKASRRRSGSIDGQQKGEKKRRNKKLHQSTDDISALSPNAMKFKQNRSFDNLFNVASPCSSTDSLSNLDDFHSADLMYPYNSEAFGRPRSTSNVSNVSSVSGRMTPTQLDIDAELETSNLVVNGGAEETANMVECMTIDGQQHRSMASTINLNDSLKMMKKEPGFQPTCANGGTDPLLPPQRPHSDSFGSGDSGYESPAYFSPPQQGQQNRPGALGKLPSPVPSKPPPPYNQTFGGPINRQPQQSMFGNRMNNFYPQQQQQQQTQQQQQGRMAHNHMAPAPRLTHLPMQAQQTFSPHQNNMQPAFNQQQHNVNHFGANMQQMQPNPGRAYDNFMATTHANMVAPNVTMNTKMSLASQFQQQQQHQQQQMTKTVAPSVNVYGTDNTMTMDIPDDLHQVRLFDFADQQQLASDLDVIIKNELRDSRSLQSICGPVTMNNDSNNNSNPLNIQTPTSFPLSGQNWVR